MNTIPIERINVFISSAMAMEKGTEWLDVRKKIKQKLDSCPYINPFIIEDHAREISSIDYFTYRVANSDVVILLLKEELRKGVEVEISVAQKYKKPMLIYFYAKGNRDLKSEAFKKQIEKKDCCTYKVFEKFDGLENIIYNDVIENVIEYYKYTHFKASEIYDNSIEELQDNIVNKFPIVYEVKKTNIKLFEKCTDFIWNNFILNTKQQVPNFNDDKDEFIYNFGNAILNYIIGKGKFPVEHDINRFLELIKKYHNNRDWIVYRWDAIRYYNMEKYEKALLYAEKAKKDAEDNNAPDWLIDDILIDCRNIENQISMIKKVYSFKYQKEIKNRESLIHLPVTDRFKENALEASIDSYLKINSNSPYTTQLGSNMKECLKNVENYIFSALIYGSNTHLLMSRDLLAKVFYMYGISFNDNNILFKSVIFKLLLGQYKDFHKILSTYWNKLYINIIQNVEYLWSLACRTDEAKRSKTMILVFKVLGAYMPDDLFGKACFSIRDLAYTINPYDSDEVLKSIYNNLYRMNNFQVIEILNNLLRNNRIVIFSEFCRILDSIDFHGITSENKQLLELEKLITKNIDIILKNNGSCYFVGNMRKSFPDRFTDLERIVLDRVDETQRIIYNLDNHNSNAKKALLYFINMTELQYKENSKGEAISYFLYNPLKAIKQVIKNYFNEREMKDILVNSFIPLCKNILISSVPFSMKSDCVDVLISIIQAFKIHIVEYNWGDFCEEIFQEQDSLSSGFKLDIFEVNNPEIFNLKLILLKTLCGYNTKKDILLKYFSLNQKDELERLAVAQCIKQYIEHNNSNERTYESMFLPIIFNMSSDTYFEIRMVICECLALLYESEYKAAIRSKIFELMLDENHHVKNVLLNMIKFNKFNDTELDDEILKHLSNDSCYNIRIEAKKIIDIKK